MFHTISESLNQNDTVNGVIYLIFSHSLDFMQNKFCGEFKLRSTSLRSQCLFIPRDEGLSEVLQEIIQDDVGVDARVVRGVGEEVRHHCLSHLIIQSFCTWKPPNLMTKRTNERQQMTQVGGFVCLELFLCGIRELT